MKRIIISICLITLFQSLFGQTKMRTAEELTSDTTAWPLLQQEIAGAKNKVEILKTIAGKNKEAIYQTQVTTHSYMGAVVYFTGGLLIDDGWIRILGSGNPKLNRSLPGWNKGKSFKEFGEKPNFLLIADDVVGGFFAINGGEFGQDLGQIYYLAPESLKWEALNITYLQFLNFCFAGDINKFYEDLRWKGWREEIRKLSPDQVFSFYPFLWTAEGKDINKVSRKIVPVQEQYDFSIDSMKQLKQ
ncbi:DUF2625 domain-containing protein [Mucilaginibacter sp. SMC90]|uniref:DUF2625 domain-containing protein n=1 Tax=Mucilaginibacter sp. SMC90 TaxID=2929803 RepID=UPI001FB3F7C9|nr:DUF2625 domain-containing protein [Mucilaginibacter sp. SMC90]UOE51785.1 DUF2625 domain-containing protein [Mucilaginibacter sp. SMC90]